MIVFVSTLASAASAHATSELSAIVEAAPTCDAARPRCVEIRLHVARSETGLVATPAWFAAQLAAANRHFEPVGVGFQLAGAAALPAHTAHLRTRADRTALAKHVGGAVIDVFITGQLDDVDEPGATIYGVAWRSGTRKFVIVSTVARDFVLAHELGHVFGLPHSTHAISIMNKTPRAEPPVDQRTFADEEIARMRTMLARLLRTKVIASVTARRS